MKKIVLLIAFLVIVLSAVPAWSPLGRATIMGTITDPSGAVIQGVSVIAVNQDTGVKTSGVTNDLGIYRVMDLPIGRYGLYFAKAGFERMGRTSITLTIGQVAEINVAMKVGQAATYTRGSTFQFQLKSGTNQFHGSAEGFLQNEALDANSWMNNFGGVPRARNRRDDENFAVGGPVWIPKVYNGRDKTLGSR